MECTVKGLMTELTKADNPPHAKVTIVGVGQVGMACAYSMVMQHVANELCLVNVSENRLIGEMMDLQHGLAFVRNVTIKAGTDYAITSGSKICVITAGARQKEGEPRLSLTQRNVDVFQGIIPNLVKYSPNTILLVVTNPVDVMTFVAWKMSGLPKEKVLGSGTHLDTARMRFLMSEKFNICPTACHGWVIGEHGDSSVPVWSGVNIAGVHLNRLNPQMGQDNDAKQWKLLHRTVVESAYEIIRMKGYTCWAVGLSVSNICYCIVRNTRDLFAVSINMNGLHGIDQDVYLSLPCVLGDNGVTHIIRQPLSERELQQLHASAKTLFDQQEQLLAYVKSSGKRYAGCSLN